VSAQPTAIPTLPSIGFVRIDLLVTRTKSGVKIPGITGVSKPTLWRMVRDGRFPKPVKLSGGVTAWPVDRVRAWIDSRSE
jgi:prophage regulatory protein